MFFEGDLQSGISKAVLESKLVICFVTDDGEESQLWETEFLTDPKVLADLSTYAISLRLKAGSQEAGYLSAIYPLPKVPTLVVIRNGELKEYLVSGTSKDDFLRRLGLALRTVNLSDTGSLAATPDSELQRESQVPQSEGAQQPPPAVQNLLSERRARLEAEKREQDKKDEEKRKADTKARKAALDAAEGPNNKASADRKYALMQKKRQQEARDERARILKRVEDDKAARRDREAERKAQHKANHVNNFALAASSTMKPLDSSTECALQVRLFDGSTVRSRFSPDSTLRHDVKPWIDESQNNDVPYTFKHILSPLPNRNIEASEEDWSLSSLGLTPTATLILVPISDYTSAYETTSTGHLVTRGVSAGYSFLSSSIGTVSGLLAGILGAGPTPNRSEDSAPSNLTSPPPASTKVRTLKNAGGRKDNQQFYNGNATNFEPRREDDDDKEE